MKTNLIARQLLVKTNLIATVSDENQSYSKTAFLETNLIARQLLMKTNRIATVSHENQSYSYSFS